MCLELQTTLMPSSLIYLFSLWSRLPSTSPTSFAQGTRARVTTARRGASSSRWCLKGRNRRCTSSNSSFRLKSRNSSRRSRKGSAGYLSTAGFPSKIVDLFFVRFIDVTYCFQSVNPHILHFLKIFSLDDHITQNIFPIL